MRNSQLNFDFAYAGSRPSMSHRNSRSCRPFKALPTSWRPRGRLLFVLKSIGWGRICWNRPAFLEYLKIARHFTQNVFSVKFGTIFAGFVACETPHFLQSTEFDLKEVRWTMYHDNVDHHVCDPKHCPRGDHTNHHQHQQHLDDNEGSEDVFLSNFIFLKLKHESWTSYHISFYYIHY